MKSNHELFKRPTVLERKDSDILQVGVFRNSEVTDNVFKKNKIRIRIKNTIKENI